MKHKRDRRFINKTSTDDNMSNGSTNLIQTPRNLIEIEASAKSNLEVPDQPITYVQIRQRTRQNQRDQVRQSVLTH